MATPIYEAEVHGFFKLIKPLVVNEGKRAPHGDCPRLKELMEAHAL